MDYTSGIGGLNVEKDEFVDSNFDVKKMMDGRRWTQQKFYFILFGLKQLGE